jgi:hypothetical protein
VHWEVSIGVVPVCWEVGPVGVTPVHWEVGSVDIVPMQREGVTHVVGLEHRTMRWGVRCSGHHAREMGGGPSGRCARAVGGCRTCA